MIIERGCLFVSLLDGAVCWYLVFRAVLAFKWTPLQLLFFLSKIHIGFWGCLIIVSENAGEVRLLTLSMEWKPSGVFPAVYMPGNIFALTLYWFCMYEQKICVRQ